MATGCTTNIQIALQAHGIQDSVPTAGAVHPYPSATPPSPLPSPLLSIYVSSEADLDALSTHKDIHHLYYNLLACSSASSRSGELLSGTVFQASSDELTEFGLVTPDDHHFYKVFIPMDLDHLLAKANEIGTLNVDEELKKAAASGFCVRMGGGTMWGSGLMSNAIEIPLAVTNNALVIAESQ